MSSDLKEKLATLRIERDDEAREARPRRGLWLALAAALVFGLSVFELIFGFLR